MKTSSLITAILFAGSFTLAFGQATNSALPISNNSSVGAPRMVAALFDKALVPERSREIKTNATPVFSNADLSHLPPPKIDLDFGTKQILTKEEEKPGNWVEEAIARGEMGTEFFQNGHLRATDKYSMWFLQMGAGSHIDWFVDNDYPAHVGNIGKDDWLVGIKWIYTPKAKSLFRWRSH